MSEVNGASDRAGLFARYMHWKPKVSAVVLPDGGTCYVRELDVGTLDGWEVGNISYNADGEIVRNGNQRARFAVRCLCDANGARLFRDEEADAVSNWPAAIVDAIYQAARTLNGLGEQETKEKNSSSRAAPGDSCTGSPATSDAS